MQKIVLRAYNKNDNTSLLGNCYFLVLPDDYNDLELEKRLCQIAGLRWQQYTNYIIGIADINDNEEFWSEISNYELKEVRIHISRVNNIKYYNIPRYIIGY